MKIVNIILTSENGGAEQVFIDYSVALKNLGHEVLVILKNDAPYAEEIEKLGFKVKKISNYFGDHDLFAVFNIIKILHEFDADLVVAHVGRSIVLTRKAIKTIRHKKILQIAVNHSMNVKRSIGADIVISVNKQIFYRTIDTGQKEDKSFVVHNAIDLSDAIEIAPKINLKEKEEIIIGVIGRLDKAKGFRYAIRAIKNLESLYEKNFRLKIAGSGSREAYLRSLVRELNLEDRVEFCGWIKNKKEFFESIDIFLMPSQRETFGLVLLEAMKYRKPIISTDADGPKEILSNGLEDSDKRISVAIIEAIENPELVDEMIKNSFKKLKEKFSYKSLENKLREIVGACI